MTRSRRGRQPRSDPWPLVVVVLGAVLLALLGLAAFTLLTASCLVEIDRSLWRKDGAADTTDSAVLDVTVKPDADAGGEVDGPGDLDAAAPGACDNGLDDDGDGAIDTADPGCSGPTDSKATSPGRRTAPRR